MLSTAVEGVMLIVPAVAVPPPANCNVPLPTVIVPLLFSAVSLSISDVPVPAVFSNVPLLLMVRSAPQQPLLMKPTSAWMLYVPALSNSMPETLLIMLLPPACVIVPLLIRCAPAAKLIALPLIVIEPNDPTVNNPLRTPLVQLLPLEVIVRPPMPVSVPLVTTSALVDAAEVTFSVPPVISNKAPLTAPPIVVVPPLALSVPAPVIVVVPDCV